MTAPRPLILRNPSTILQKKKGGKERTETPPEIQQRGKKGKRLGTGMCTSGDPWQLEEKEEELLISPEMPEEGNIFAT